MSAIFFDDYFVDGGRTYRVQASRCLDGGVTICVSSGTATASTSTRVEMSAEALEGVIRYIVNTKSPFTLEQWTSTLEISQRLHAAIGYRAAGACECGAAKCKTTHSLWCPARAEEKAA